MADTTALYNRHMIAKLAGVKIVNVAKVIKAMELLSTSTGLWQGDMLPPGIASPDCVNAANGSAEVELQYTDLVRRYAKNFGGDFKEADRYLQLVRDPESIMYEADRHDAAESETCWGAPRRVRERKHPQPHCD